MYRHTLNEAVELGAVSVTSCRNGWWKVSFTYQLFAGLFREHAISEGWSIIGSGNVFGVRPTP